jgi:MinD-like ATPase involved in chromosome partitioning or flagellar assembly
MFRRLHAIPADTRKLIRNILDSDENRELKTLDALVASVEQKQPKHGKLLRDTINEMSLHLIVNQVREPAHYQLGQSLALVWNRYFGRKPNHLYHLIYDESVSRNLCRKKRFLETHPQSRVAIHIKQLAASMTHEDSH